MVVRPESASSATVEKRMKDLEARALRSAERRRVFAQVLVMGGDVLQTSLMGVACKATVVPTAFSSVVQHGRQAGWP